MQGDGELKLARIRAYLKEKGYTGLVLLRQDNFAWLTTGGLNRVVVPSAEGFGAAVITETQSFLVAQVMDGRRIMDEEVNGLPLEYAPLRWYEESVLERALKLAGKNPAADAPCRADCPLSEIYDLHTPYTPGEIARFFEIGVFADQALIVVAGEVVRKARDDRLRGRGDAALRIRQARRDRGRGAGGNGRAHLQVPAPRTPPAPFWASTCF